MITKKILKVLGWISLAILITASVGALCYLFLSATRIIPRDAVLVTDSRYERYTQVSLIRELTQVPDFPPFDSETYEYTNEKGEKEIYLKCSFNPSVPEDSVWALRGKMQGGWQDEDSNGGMDFVKGWSKREYMTIPEGVKEEMILNIHMYCGDNEFYLSFKKNPCAESVSKDSLNHYLGVQLPEFTIVNYISPDMTILQFNGPIPESTYRLLEKNDWCEHKIEEDGTSFCWITKKEPGEYSTYIEIDDQMHTAILSKFRNE